MPSTCCGQREQIRSQRIFIHRAIRPKLAPRLPVHSESFVMRDRVLNNQSFHALRVRQNHAKTHRPAIVLHVERVARESERFGEMIHDLGVVIERVRECLRIRPVTVPETGVIGSDQVIAIGEAGEERLEHSRRRRQTV